MPQDSEGAAEGVSWLALRLPETFILYGLTEESGPAGGWKKRGRTPCGPGGQGCQGDPDLGLPLLLRQHPSS